MDTDKGNKGMPLFDTAIRPATRDDIEIIVEYNRRLAFESEQKTLPVETLRLGVEALLADSRRGRYFLACVDGQVVGQVMLTTEWSDWRNGDFWWIQSVYVHTDYRRRGIFKALQSHVEELARKTPGVVGLRLYVEHSNAIARQTYERAGLTPTGYLVLEKEFRLQPASWAKER
jgi:ribosomal protein S18 acetylase RimI-like enzyme